MSDTNQWKERFDNDNWHWFSNGSKPLEKVKDWMEENVVQPLQAENAALKERIKQLEDWQQSAIDVMPDFQTIGKLLDLGARDRVSENIIPGIEKLKERVAELQAKVNDLTMADMTHEYNDAEGERFWPELKKQIEEPFKNRIAELEQALKDQAEHYERCFTQ